MTSSLTGKTAIVTGAAHGVGLAVARALVAAGAQVVLADLDEAALEREAAALTAAGGAVRLFAGDLRQKLTIANLLAVTTDDFDRIDILVNAARRVELTDPLGPDDQSLEELLQHNLVAAYRMSQAVARRMIRQAAAEGAPPETSAGAIVNISSIAARRAHPDLVAYAISAAAADQMTRALAVALAPHRIRVNGVAHGSVLSAGLSLLIRDEDEARDEIVTHTPMARLGAPEDVAAAALFLAGEGAGFVTGQILTVDGGRSLIDPAQTPLR